MALEYWSPIADEYDPVRVGSIDGTDTTPHDHGIVRALNATYRPNKGVIGDPLCTLFVGRLNYVTTESAVEETFSKFAPVRRIRLVRDVVTGFSKGYAFVEFYDEHTTKRVCRDAASLVLDDKQILVEFECERTLSGWVPRRLGGGFGGRKEAGQLRFGGRDRPFRKPILVAPLQTQGRDDSRTVDRKPAAGVSFARAQTDDRYRSERSESRSRDSIGTSRDSNRPRHRHSRSDDSSRHRSRSRSRSRR
jgi:U11/U12 small nuclear ribonucleoprotein SNRNP35